MGELLQRMAAAAEDQGCQDSIGFEVRTQNVYERSTDVVAFLFVMRLLSCVLLL